MPCKISHLLGLLDPDHLASANELLLVQFFALHSTAPPEKATSMSNFSVSCFLLRQKYPPGIRVEVDLEACVETSFVGAGRPLGVLVLRVPAQPPTAPSPPPLLSPLLLPLLHDHSLFFSPKEEHREPVQAESSRHIAKPPSISSWLSAHPGNSCLRSQGKAG